MLAIQRWFLSFAACLASYFGYALLIAPIFEPPPLKVVASAAPVGPRPRDSRSFDHLFAPDAWQCSRTNPPKVIEADQCTLLFDEYSTVGGGQIDIDRCTLIFYMDDAEESQQPATEGRKRRPVVLDAPEGAMLIFDRELDLARAEFGRLIGGKLRGEIRIFSPPTRTDMPDDLELKTRNLQIDESKIWTPHDVTFRYGNSHGGGKDLTIQLANTGNTRKTPAFGGISQMQLAQVDKIHIDLAGANLFMDEEGAPEKADRSAQPPQPPVEVRCKGPFRFDFLQHIASFDDRVEVRRMNPLGEPDKLLCQRLTFLLRNPKSPLPESAKREGALGKAAEKLRRITAEGNPAVILGPTIRAEVRAARIDYDLETGRVVLAPSPSQSQVLMHYEASQLSAHQVEYEMGAEGKIGRLFAEGPGKLTYTRPATGKGPEQLSAQWQRELRVRPHENNQVISLLGQAKVSVGEAGSFAADELHLWAVETPVPASPQATKAKKGPLPSFSVNLRPDRLLALRNVQIDSTRLTGQTQRLEAWFTPQTPAAGPAPLGVPAKAVSTGGNVLPQSGNATSTGGSNFLAGSTGNAATTASPARAPGPGNPTSPPASPGPAAAPPATSALPNPFVIRQPGTDGAPASEEPTSRYDVAGDLIRLQWMMVGATAQASNLVLEDLSVEGNVRITETETAKPEDEPLVVTGTAVQVQGASSLNASLQLIGKPAKLSARGLSLSGAVVNVHKGQNRAWIDGPGVATLPLPSNLALAPGQQAAPMTAPTAPPIVARLTWKDGLNFDGQTITVSKDITLVSDNQTASAQVLEVTLARRIDFAQPQSKEPMELGKLLLDGGVAIENRSLDPLKQEIASHDSLRCRNLLINRVSGELKADGPGWVSTSRRGNALPAAPGAAPMAIAVPSSASSFGPNANGLSYLYVEFDQGILGNINQHRVRFVGKVRTVFGPIQDFGERLETVTDDRLPEQAVRLICDDLQITEMVFPNDRKWLELAAQGNTEVEGQTFNAKAARIGYSTEKEQLVLEGDGRMDAQIWYRSGPGKPRAFQQARKIMYWRKTNQIDIEGGGAGTLEGIQGIALPRGPLGSKSK